MREGLAEALSHEGGPVVVQLARLIPDGPFVTGACSVPCGGKLYPEPRQAGTDREDRFGDQDDRAQHTIDLIVVILLASQHSSVHWDGCTGHV